MANIFEGESLIGSQLMPPCSITKHRYSLPFFIIIFLIIPVFPCRGIETTPDFFATKTYYFVPQLSKPLQIDEYLRPKFSKLLTDPSIGNLSNSDLVYYCVDGNCECAYVALFKSNLYKGLFCVAPLLGNMDDIWMSFYDELTDSWSRLYFTGHSFADIDRAVKNLNNTRRGRDIDYQVYLTSTSVINDVVTIEFQLRYAVRYCQRDLFSVFLDFDISEIRKDSDGDGLTDNEEDRLKTNKYPETRTVTASAISTTQTLSRRHITRANGENYTSLCSMISSGQILTTITMQIM